MENETNMNPESEKHAANFLETTETNVVPEPTIDWEPMEYTEIGTQDPQHGIVGLSPAECESVAGRLAEIGVLSPVEIEQRLLDVGYRGQQVARRAGSVLAYRHVMRLRRRFMEKRPMDALPTREHYLFLGSTGSGKTYLTELLFREIIKVPTLVADMTRFSETGYVGDDVQMLVSHLFELADKDRGWASCGVICVDEFDKLASSRSSTRFAGEGTTKDVSGFGVQRGLLTLLSGKYTTFPADFGYSGHGAQLTMPLDNMLFIACGAFSGLKGLADVTGSNASVGFGQSSKSEVDDAIAMKVGNTLLENTTVFSQYGMLPELIGRFSRLVPFQPLDEATLRDILDDTLLDQYHREFADENVELIIDDEVLGEIVTTAIRRETGARGLRASLVPHLEEAAFETFGKPGGGRAHLMWKKDRVVVDAS